MCPRARKIFTKSPDNSHKLHRIPPHRFSIMLTTEEDFPGKQSKRECSRMTGKFFRNAGKLTAAFIAMAMVAGCSAAQAAPKPGPKRGPEPKPGIHKTAPKPGHVKPGPGISRPKQDKPGPKFNKPGAKPGTGKPGPAFHKPGPKPGQGKPGPAFHKPGPKPGPAPKGKPGRPGPGK